MRSERIGRVFYGEYRKEGSCKRGNGGKGRGYGIEGGFSGSVIKKEYWNGSIEEKSR